MIGREAILRIDGSRMICFRSFALSTENEPADISDSCTGAFAVLSRLRRSQRVELSVDGIANTAWLRDRVFESRLFISDGEFVFPDGASLSGEFVITAYSENGSWNDATAFSGTLVINGQYVYVAAGSSSSSGVPVSSEPPASSSSEPSVSSSEPVASSSEPVVSSSEPSGPVYGALVATGYDPGETNSLNFYDEYLSLVPSDNTAASAPYRGLVVGPSTVAAGDFFLEVFNHAGVKLGDEGPEEGQIYFINRNPVNGDFAVSLTTAGAGVRIYDSSWVEKTPASPLIYAPGSFPCNAYSPNGQWLAYAHEPVYSVPEDDYSRIMILRTSDYQDYWVPPLPGQPNQGVQCLRFSDDSTQLFCGDAAGTLARYNTTNYTRDDVIGPLGRPRCLEEKGDYLIVGEENFISSGVSQFSISVWEKMNFGGGGGFSYHEFGPGAGAEADEDADTGRTFVQSLHFNSDKSKLLASGVRLGATVPFIHIYDTSDPDPLNWYLLIKVDPGQLTGIITSRWL